MSNFHGDDRAQWAVAGIEVCQSVYEPGKALPRHDHEHAFWCLTLGGGYSEHIGRRRREAGRGHLAWHPPGEHHHLKFGDRDTTAINIELSAEWFDSIADSGLKIGEPRDLGAAGARLVQELVAELNNDDADVRLGVETLIAELLAETAHFGETPAFQDAPEWLLASRDYLHAHHTETLRLADIAEAVDIHPVHLARSYRRLTGRPVGEYLRMLRTNAARELLRKTNRALADIATDCGFSDQPHFCRVFRHFTGVTPARYRSATR